MSGGGRERIMYVELVSGHNHDGPAWITRVRFSKTGRSVYFHGKRLKRLPGAHGANHVDVETGEEYWVSGVKANRQDRHWAGRGPVLVDDDVRDDYERLIHRPGGHSA